MGDDRARTEADERHSKYLNPCDDGIEHDITCPDCKERLQSLFDDTLRKYLIEHQLRDETRSDRRHDMSERRDGMYSRIDLPPRPKTITNEQEIESTHGPISCRAIIFMSIFFLVMFFMSTIFPPNPYHIGQSLCPQNRGKINKGQEEPQRR